MNQPQPEVAALLRQLRATDDIEMELSPDGDALWTSWLIDDVVDRAGNVVFSTDSPFPVWIRLDPLDADRCGLTVESPPIRSPGTFATYDPPQPLPFEIHWHENDGVLTISVRRAVRVADVEIDLAMDEMVVWYLQLHRQLLDQEVVFTSAEELEVDAPVTTEGFRQLRLSNEAILRGDSETGATLAREASRIFEHAGLEELEIRADSLLVLCDVIERRTTDALAKLAACEARARSLVPRSTRLDAILSAIYLQVNLGAGNFAPDAATRFDALPEADRDDLLSGMSAIVEMAIPGRASQVAAAIEHQSEGLGDDPADAERQRAMMFHKLRVGDRQAAYQHADALADLAADAGLPDAEELAQMRDVLRILSGSGGDDGSDTDGPAGPMAAEAKPPPRGPGRFADLLDALVDLDTTDESVDRSGPLSKVGSFAAALRSLLPPGAENAVSAPEPGPEVNRFVDQMAGLVQSHDDPLLTGLNSAGLALARLHAAAPASVDERRLAATLNEVLAGIAQYDLALRNLAGLGDRASFRSDGPMIFEMAMALAAETGRPEVVVELLERLRLLGVPDGTPNLATGLFPVTDPPHISINGTSVLGGDGARTVAFEDRLASQGGEGCWWWSAWQGPTALLWATRSPAGEYDAAAYRLYRDATRSEEPESSTIGTLLDGLRRSLQIGGGPEGAEPVEPTSGLFGSMSRAGIVPMQILGQTMIPPGLRAAMATATRAEPIRLLYDLGPSLAWLPIGLFGLDSSPRPVRVIERAVIQMLAPETPSRPPRPVAGHGTFAVIDPSSDLDHVRDLISEGDRVLIGERPDLTSDRDDRGSIAGETGDHREVTSGPDLLKELAAAESFEFFLYAGHATSGRPADPLSGGLTIGRRPNQSTLSVAELIDAAPGIEVPDKVLLCACSTAASAIDPQVERWGVPFALMMGGARSVVATRWDLPASASTVQFVRELLHQARIDDVAAAVRNVQLRWLDGWAKDFAAGSVEFDETSSDCHHPLVWAPFVAMSVVPPDC